MKVLRFRAIEPEQTIRCGNDYYAEGSNRFPIPFTLKTGGQPTTINLVNDSGSPIKMKVYTDGVFFKDTPYIGDSSFQNELDDYNLHNYMPLELIENTMNADIDVPSGFITVTAKVYCPLKNNYFYINFSCG